MNSISAIVLAAGRGTRMTDNSRNKVSFDCAGVPVIRRVVMNLKEAGVGKIAVVVGFLAQDVIEALDGIPGVVFAYQEVQNGTGSAALAGMRLLKESGYSGDVIVTVGDRIISSELLRDFVGCPGRAVYGVQPAGINRSGGRIAVKDGRPCGIVEFADAAVLKVLPMQSGDRKAALIGLGLSGIKAESALKKAEQTAKDRKWFIKAGEGCMKVAGETFTADELLGSGYTNLSLYRFDLDSALTALASCAPGNVQGEIYLTDTMEYFAERGEARIFPMDDASGVVTYSTRPELIRMSRVFLRRLSELPVGPGTAAKAADAFAEKYGDLPAVLVRAPGRVNILGRHIDHRGGNTNVMAIDRSVAMVASPREDRMLRLSNADSLYPDYEIVIDEITGGRVPADWLSFIESERITGFVDSHRGAWYNYVIAAVARLETAAGIPLCGMNIAVCGNIPAAAGLSSSSAITVAAAEAVNALNCLSLRKERFVELCGEAEWFVGTRGGAGDHAAIRCSKKGRITRLCFLPFEVGESAPFPDGYGILIADSGIRSKKAEGNRDRFNEKVASSEVAFMLMRKYYPQYGMERLRDAAKIRPFSRIYEMIKRVPADATRRDIADLMPENRESLGRVFSTHRDPGSYDLRGPVLFGITECARSAACLGYLERADLEGLGRLMKISHLGDRVSGEFPMRITDAYLDECAAKDADPALQPGAYGCSLSEIDGICELLDGTPGVLGSQMLGAGLGGCVAALIELPKSEQIKAILRKEYYDRRGLECLAEVYLPGDGSSVVF